jgi:hypothetical protein
MNERILFSAVLHTSLQLYSFNAYSSHILAVIHIRMIHFSLETIKEMFQIWDMNFHKTFLLLWQWSPASNHGYALVHTNVCNIPECGQVQLMMCSSGTGLSFGSTCYRVLPWDATRLRIYNHQRVRTIFNRDNIACARYDTFVGCTGEICSTNQNSHPPIEIDNPIVISICVQMGTPSEL